MIIDYEHMSQLARIANLTHTYRYQLIPTFPAHQTIINEMRNLGYITPQGEELTPEIETFFNTLQEGTDCFEDMCAHMDQNQPETKNTIIEEMPAILKDFEYQNRITTIPRTTLCVALTDTHIASMYSELPKYSCHLDPIPSSETNIIDLISHLFWGNRVATTPACDIEEFYYYTEQTPFHISEEELKKGSDKIIPHDQIVNYDWDSFNEEYEKTGLGLPPKATYWMQKLTIEYDFCAKSTLKYRYKEHNQYVSIPYYVHTHFLKNKTTQDYGVVLSYDGVDNSTYEKITSWKPGTFNNFRSAISNLVGLTHDPILIAKILGVEPNI